jgi:predicted outer membrane protein
MKLPVLFSISLLAASSALFAQTTSTPATTGTSTATTGAGAKAKPLASSDKTFIKNSTESIFFLTSLADRVRTMSKDATFSESTTTLGKKIGTELGKVWGEIGAIASSSGEPLPTALKGSDKTKVANLGKLKEDKFEKEFGELSAKEAKQLVTVLENGAKSAQNPELKSIAEKWVPTAKVIADEAAALSKSAGKK